MKIAALVVLAIAAASCAPSKDIESPADPPGIEKEDDAQKSGDGAQASGEADLEVSGEADAESESGE